MEGLMFIIVKKGITSDDILEQSEIEGRKTLKDNEVDIVLSRINVHQIEEYCPAFKSNDATIIELSSGRQVHALEPLEAIEQKIQTASLYPLGN